MDNKIHLSLIIPTYNEAKRLPITLIDVDRHFYNADFSYEIIVVDAGSTDGTTDMALKFPKLVKNLRVISIPEKGKGLAIKTGMLNAKGDYRAFIAADNSISADQVIDALPYFKQGYDLIVGSRAVKGGQRDEPWYQVVLNVLGNLIIQALILPGFWDTQCPLKIFRSEVAEKIFAVSKVNNNGCDIEMLSLANKMGYKIKQIPAAAKNDEYYRAKPYPSFGILWDIIRIRFSIWRNDYKFFIDAPPS